jgi:hypothetical protein
LKGHPLATLLNIKRVWKSTYHQDTTDIFEHSIGIRLTAFRSIVSSRRNRNFGLYAKCLENLKGRDHLEDLQRL